jgi:hypothetical protein
MGRRRNWQELLSGGSASALEAAEQDLLPDVSGYASVFEVTTELQAVGASSAMHTPSNGQTRCQAVNARHHDVLLNGPQRQHLATLIAQRTAGTIPRIRRKEIERAAATCPWLPPDSRLR